MFWTFFNIILIYMIVNKFLEFLRANDTFSAQVKLVKLGLAEITPFGVFFTGWLFIFTTIFILEGALLYETDPDNLDYVEIPYFIATFIQVFRNSIGDISAPRYDFWLRSSQQSQGEITWSQGIMIFVVWFTFLFNIVFNLIMMMNFLIAIVSQSWD